MGIETPTDAASNGHRGAVYTTRPAPSLALIALNRPESLNALDLAALLQHPDFRTDATAWMARHRKK